MAQRPCVDVRRSHKWLDNAGTTDGQRQRASSSVGRQLQHDYSPFFPADAICGGRTRGRGFSEKTGEAGDEAEIGGDAGDKDHAGSCLCGLGATMTQATPDRWRRDGDG
uniref:Uncharacterized protein n=1 Tax=Oryza sativa subsp. japonica TaxID=39947 RepID=Q6ZL13_ORYSJ|nr:hypothetical protein [Oryza sativa Japonica Group]BAD30226.1 hypothetical protein [Oryza sativa Japonica Group]